MPKRVKKLRKIVLNKYQRVTQVSICIFSGLFKTIVFRSESASHKKVIGFFGFFFHRPESN